MFTNPDMKHTFYLHDKRKSRSFFCTIKLSWIFLVCLIPDSQVDLQRTYIYIYIFLQSYIKFVRMWAIFRRNWLNFYYTDLFRVMYWADMNLPVPPSDCYSCFLDLVTPTCFDPRMSSIENGSDLSTFSTTFSTRFYFEKSLYEQRH